MTRNVLGSNTSRPVPPANTGSAVLNWISDTSLRLVQLQRRVDPWIRPAFDAVLRDPITSLTTALINLQRRNEGLKIAEERVQPDEEASLQSIIDTFQQQMRGLWKPGGFERGGNTKTHGIVRAEFIVHDGLPPQFRHGIYAQPQHLSGMGPLFRARALRDAGHRRRGVHEHQHQADGSSRTKADGRREIHAGHVRRVHADFRHAGHARERSVAA